VFSSLGSKSLFSCQSNILVADSAVVGTYRTINEQPQAEDNVNERMNAELHLKWHATELAVDFIKALRFLSDYETTCHTVAFVGQKYVGLIHRRP